MQQKLEEIRECWSDLESTTKAKARQLFENNKPEPAVKSYSDLDSQLSHLEQQPPQLEQAHHLPTFNEQLQKFQVGLKSPEGLTPDWRLFGYALLLQIIPLAILKNLIPRHAFFESFET